MPSLLVSWKCCYMTKKPCSSGAHLGSKSCNHVPHNKANKHNCSVTGSLLCYSCCWWYALMLKSFPFSSTPEKTMWWPSFKWLVPVPSFITPAACHLGRKHLQGKWGNWLFHTSTLWFFKINYRLNPPNTVFFCFWYALLDSAELSGNISVLEFQRNEKIETYQSVTLT